MAPVFFKDELADIISSQNQGQYTPYFITNQPASIPSFIHEPFYWSKPIGWLFKFQSASYFSIQTLPIPKGCFNFGYF
jgi:membrane-bound acyltransferase YfiQ involved in biofilm formation